MASVVFFFPPSFSIQGRAIYEGTCVFSERWIQQVGRGGGGGGGGEGVWHSRYLTRPVKVLGLSHYPWRSVKTCSKTLLTGLGLPAPAPAAPAAVRIFIFFPP